MAGLFDDVLKPRGSSGLFDDVLSPKKEGALARAGRIAKDEEGGILAAAGSLIASALPEGGQKRTSGGFLADTGVDVVRGVVGLGQGIIGLGNLVSLGALGKGMEEIGYSGEQTQKFLGGLYTADRQQAEQNVEEAKGFFNTLGELAVNPSVVLGAVVQAVPQTVGAGAAGGAMVRALLPGATKAAKAAGLAGDDATKFITDYVAKRATLAAGASEGALTAGSIAEAGREAGQDYTTYAPAALAGGAVTGIIGAASGSIGRRVGLGDIEADIAMRGAGVSPTTAATAGSRLATIGKEALKEGVLEEAPQSFQEALATQYAQGKPFDFEEAASQAAMGLATGGVMGGFNAAVRARAPQEGPAPAPAPAADPLDAQAARMTAATDAYLNDRPGADTIASIVSKPTVDEAIDALGAESPSMDQILADKRAKAVQRVAEELGFVDQVDARTPEQIMADAATRREQAAFAAQQELGLVPAGAEPAAPVQEPIEGPQLTRGPQDFEARRRTAAAVAQRDMDLTGQAAQALTQADREGLEAQRQVALERARSPVADRTSDYVDLTPMDARAARARLSVLRDQVARQGGDSLGLVVMTHPEVRGAYAIGTRQQPSLEMPPAPAPDTPGEVAQQRLDAAAQQAQEQAQRPDENRQVVITRALRNVEERGGVASPQEAALFEEVGLGRPFDRVDESLGPAPDLMLPRMEDRGPATTASGIITDSGLPSSGRPDRPARGFGVNASLDFAPTGLQVTTSPGAAPDSTAPGIEPTGLVRALDEPAPTGGRSATKQSPIPAVPGLPGLADVINVNAAGQAGAAPEQNQALLGGERDLGTEMAKARAEAGYQAPPAAPRPQKVNGVPTSSMTDAQLEEVAGNAKLPAITRRGAQIEMGYRRSERPAPATPSGIILPSAKRTPADVLSSVARERESKVGRPVDMTVADVAALPSQRQTAAGGLSRQAHSIINNVARVFGKRLVVFESNDATAPDGFLSQDDPDTIYLNRNSEAPHLVVFGHELLHALRKDNEGAYQSLVKTIRMVEGADISTTPGIKGSVEEFTADLLGNRFRETDFWAATFRDIIASKGEQQGRKIVTRLAATATRAINGLMRALGRAPGFNTDSMVANLDEVKTALRGALSTYAKDRYGAAVAMERERVAAAPAPAPAAAAAPSATGPASERRTGEPFKPARTLSEVEGGVMESAKRRTTQATGKEVPTSVDKVADSAAAFRRARGKIFETNRELKTEIQDAVRAAAEDAGVDLSTFSEGTEKYLVRIASAEAVKALRENANAVGWYREKVTKALRIAALKHPELNTNPEARMVFIWALAVTSNGMRVKKNFELADKAYSSWKRYKKFPTNIGQGTAKKAINNGLRAYNVLSKQMTFDQLHDAMLTKSSVAQIGKLLGIKPSGEYADTVVYGSAILGPKVGNGFFANLYGHYEQLTIDRWLMRTWGRWTGTLVEVKPDVVAKKADTLSALLELLAVEQRTQLGQAIGSPVYNDDLEPVAAAISTATVKESVRDALEKIGPLDKAMRARLVEILGKEKKNARRVSLGDEIRKAGLGLHQAIDGQVEAPRDPQQRNDMRKVFDQVLAEMQKTSPGLTMSDLQAVLWYPEKRIYDAAKTDKEIDDGYEDGAAPDYANAAAEHYRGRGVTKSAIDRVIAEVDSELQAAERAGSGGRSAGGVAQQPGGVTNPDIQASEKRNIFNQPVTPSWASAPDTKLDQFIYKVQDKQIDLKRITDTIKEVTGQISDRWNAYLAEELYHGRTAKQTKGFLTDEMRPLLDAMQANRVTLPELEEYLHNRHAEERNKQIATINPALPDAGSGVKTADARRYLAGLTPDQRQRYDALAKRVDAINKKTRQLLVDSGLETQETIDNWERTYPSYVPLFREDADYDGAFSKGGTGLGYSVRGPASKRATGSATREVVDIVANIAMMRERTITRAEKLRVSNALYGLAVQNPNPDFWLAVDPQSNKNPQAAIDALVNMGMSPQDARGLMQEPTVPHIDPRTGIVTYRVNPRLRNEPNVLATRVNGQDKLIFFNPRDPRAERMMAALKNLDAEQMGMAMSLAGAVSRWFAKVNTQYNPVFGAINLIRDLGGATLNLSTTPIADKKARVVADTGPAILGIYQALRGARKGKKVTGDWADLWNEFQQEGGQTGFRDQFSRSEERAQALQAEFDRMGRPGYDPRRLVDPDNAVFGWLSDYNETLENGVRLAAYKAAKDKGMSNAQAASVAKNLTVNFNRKGTVGVQAGALYAFFNASVQGTARLAETLGKGRDPNAAAYNPKRYLGTAGRRIIAGGFLLGVMQALALAAAGFDEDEPPEFIKERNLVIPIGDGKYFTIPMPLGFNVIPNTGRILTEWGMSGFKDTPKRVASLTGSFLEMFNPIGNAGWSVQTIAPTFADPLVALAENRDWTGKPIAKKDMSGTDPTPGYTRAKDTASILSKGIAYAMNAVSGGTDYKPGIISPTPDQIDYLIGQITGGVGREILKVSQAAESAVTGEELPTYKVPVAGRFYGDTKEMSAVSSRFYENLTRINMHENEIKGRRQDRVPIGDYLVENPEARLVTLKSRIDREVSELKRRKREMIKRDASKESVKLIETAITRRMQQFNDAVERAQALEPAAQ